MTIDKAVRAYVEGHLVDHTERLHKCYAILRPSNIASSCRWP